MWTWLVFGCGEPAPCVSTGDEVCDAIDNDCNGQVDDGVLAWSDNDHDGFGDALVACENGDPDTLVGGDCVDNDPAIHPGAPERCNRLDDDCDVDLDEPEDLGPGEADGWLDADRDGAGDPATPACTTIGGVSNDDDCDDGDFSIQPGHDEECNQIDDDCDGQVDEHPVDEFVVRTDRDGDGFTHQHVGCLYLDQPMLPGGDCDDDSVDVFPGAADACDGIDRDCDGRIDEDDSVDAVELWIDQDGDGFGGPTQANGCPQPGRSPNDDDCYDGDAAAYPGAPEVCNDADDDCDGVVDGPNATGDRQFFLDEDGDGFGDPVTTILACSTPDGWALQGTDCDDQDGEVHPGAAEVCDTLDNDCDGLADPGSSEDAEDWFVDLDGDGWGSGSEVLACAQPDGMVDFGFDCDDGQSAIHPTAPEDCFNAIDDNCDTRVDVGCGTVYASIRIDPVGVDVDAMAAGDLDSDGVEDLVVSSSDGVVRVLFGPLVDGSTLDDAGWVFTRPVAVRPEAPPSYFLLPDEPALLVADVDRDGVLDLTVGAEDLGWIAPADLTDGTQIAAAWSVTPGGTYWFRGPLGVAAVDPDDATATIVGVAGDRAGSALAAGDLDGDGFGDLAVGAPDAERAWILPAVGPGVFDLSDGFEITGSSSYFGRVGAPLLVADADADGIDDLWVGDRSAVDLYLGPITGDLGPASAWASPGGGLEVYSLAGADVDGDGTRDLVASLPTLFSASEVCAVLTPVPAGTASTQACTEAVGGLFPVGDFDGDGTDDLAAGFYTARVLSGAGMVGGVADSEIASFDGGPSTDPVTAIDVEGDGVREVVVSGEPIGVFVTGDW